VSARTDADKEYQRANMRRWRYRRKHGIPTVFPRYRIRAAVVRDSGWSWYKLSSFAGLPTGSIYKIKNGERSPLRLTRLAICDVLKIPHDSLWERL
jgi:hypothetical protein